jgi:hypothetical protein
LPVIFVPQFPAALPVIAYINPRAAHINPRGDVISTTGGCQYLAVKMAANTEAVSA